MADNDAGTEKPNARRAGWTVVSASVPWEGKRFCIHQDKVTPPGQDKPHTYDYMESAPAVIIVPVTAQGEVVLIRQFRYACDAQVVEVPAGTRGDQDDASPEQVTRMELRQEIGATCGEVQTIADYFESPAHSNQRSTAVIAWETAMTGEPEREPGEDIQPWILPAAEALERARRGEVGSAPCALALFLAEPHLRARGFL
jgi:ADP-ribose pyrophosphatase